MPVLLLIERCTYIKFRMVYKADKLRLKKLLMDAIGLLCKNGLPVQSSFRIEATIGITLSEDEVVLVSFREVVQPDGEMVAQVSSDEEPCDDVCGFLSDEDDLNGNSKNRKGISTDANCSSSLPTTLNDKEEEEAFDPGKFWSDATSGAGNSRQTNSRNRRTSSKDNSLKHLRSNANIPEVKSSLMRCSLGDSLNDAPIQIKDEVLDDDDCCFVKMEDSLDDCAETLESLGQDDSWMYQVHNRENIFGAGSGDLMQVAQELNYSADNVQIQLHDAPPWNASSHDDFKPAHTRQNAGIGSGTRQGTRQNSANSSHSQGDGVSRTLQSLCKTLADQACVGMPGDSVFCHICGARLSSHATLVKHIKGTHLAMSTCQCEICGQSFKWTMQLCRHRKRYHSNVLLE